MPRKVRLPLSPQVTEALARFGASLKDLRRCRRVPMSHAAERAAVSRGDPGVGLGIYAAVLAGYGLLDRLEHLVQERWHRPHLPRRVRTPSV